MSCLYTEYYSEGVGEYTKTLFPKDFKGVCIDVGAFDPFWASNSWIAEKNGWDVYLVEANPNCIPRLRANRKNVYEYACAEYNADDVPFHIYRSPLVGEAAGTGLIRHGDAWSETLYGEAIPVKVRTLDWLLENEIKVDHIDYLTIDVEHNEVNVLKGLNFNKWLPKVMVIESLNDPERLAQFEVIKPFDYRYVRRMSFNDIYILESHYQTL